MSKVTVVQTIGGKETINETIDISVDEFSVAMASSGADRFAHDSEALNEWYQAYMDCDCEMETTEDAMTMFSGDVVVKIQGEPIRVWIAVQNRDGIEFE